MLRERFGKARGRSLPRRALICHVEKAHENWALLYEPVQRVMRARFEETAPVGDTRVRVPHDN